MYVYCIEMYIYSRYIVYSSVFYTNGIVIHYIGWGCRFSSPQGIHCFKWEFCVQFTQCFAGT